MTRFAVELLPEAEQEFRDAFIWHFERSPVATVLAVAHQHRHPRYWQPRR